MKGRNFWWVVVVGALVLGGGVREARAVIVYNSNGFEPPSIVSGDIEGQDVANGPWQKSGNNASTGLVQIAVKQAGLQALAASRAPTAGGDARWGVSKPIPGATRVIISFDMNVQPSALPAGSFGPFIGVEAYDELNNAPLLAGSLGVDATTGDVLYQEAGTGFLVETGALAAFGTWNSYKLVLDYTADRYSIFFNGNLLATSGFVDGGINDFTDAPVAVLAAGGDALSLSAAGTGFFDNYTIEHEIPEPGSALLGLIPMVMLATSRRRGA
jgi:hypothetical protein